MGSDSPVLPQDSRSPLTDHVEIRMWAGEDAAERANWPPDRVQRPLTEEEQAVVRDTATPLLRDMAASGLVLPDIHYEAREDRGSETVCAWIQGPGGTGAGIWIRGSSPAEQVGELAEQFQNWAADQLHDAGVLPEWPICPEHPVPRRLNPEIRDGVAVWASWEGGHVTCEIGTLAKPGVHGSKSARRRARRRLSVAPRGLGCG